MHFQPQALSLTAQLLHLRRLYPEGNGEVRRDRLYWHQDIRPHSLAHSYRCRLEYSVTDYPVVYCLDPLLSALAEGRCLPHVRSDTEPISMCLFVYEPKCWHGGMLLAEIVIPLAFYWLANFEEWLFSGVWRGGGTHDIAPSAPSVPPVFPSDVIARPFKGSTPPPAPQTTTVNPAQHAEAVH